MKKIASLLVLAAAAFGQKLAFDVASIKPAPPLNPQAILAGGKMHVGMQVDAGRVDIGYMSLNDLIPMAFKIKPNQIQGPDWLSQQRFDIMATLPDGAKPDQIPQMMQSLLAERFGLKYHNESKEQSVYALVVNKGGVKMQEAAPEEPAKPAEAGAEAPKPQGMAIQLNGGQMNVQQGAGGAVVVRANGGGMGQQGIGGVKMTMGQGGQMQMELKSTMSAFADVLSRFVDKPVIDMTELKGTYEAKLELAMTDLLAVARAQGAQIPAGAVAALGGGGGAGPNPAGAALDPGNGASIFESVQKLGLKLEPRKVPMDFLVIDKIEKNPTDN